MIFDYLILEVVTLEFRLDHPVIFILVGLIIAAVLMQSVCFLVRAWRRAIALGIDKKKLKKIVRSAAVFTIAPAVSILVGVVILSKSLGVALPWLRLSVIGSLSYETIAAEQTMTHFTLAEGAKLNAQQFVTISLVMTISILVGIWLAPLLGKRMQNGLKSIENRDKKWADIFQNSLFIGMVAAFLGFVFCDFSSIFSGLTYGLVPICVMAVSALVTLLCGILMKVTGWRWISDYALPLSLVLAMAAAIPLTAWLGSAPTA